MCGVHVDQKLADVSCRTLEQSGQRSVCKQLAADLDDDFRIRNAEGKSCIRDMGIGGNLKTDKCCGHRIGGGHQGDDKADRYHFPVTLSHR